jgi:hypothetical protein
MARTMSTIIGFKRNEKYETIRPDQRRQSTMQSMTGIRKPADRDRFKRDCKQNEF